MIKVNRSRLIDVLDFVSKAVKEVPGLPQSKDVLFTGSYVFGFGDEYMAAMEFSAPFVGSTPLSSFRELVNRMSVDELELAVEGGGLIIRGGTTKANLPFIGDILVPIPEIPVEGWVGAPPELGEVLRFVTPLTAKDYSIPAQAFVRLAPDFVEASHRVAAVRYKLDSGMNHLVSRRTATLIADMFPEYWLAKGPFIFFKSTDKLLIARHSSLDPVNLEGIFNVDGTRVVFPEGLKDSLNRVAVIEEGTPLYATLYLEPGQPLKVVGTSTLGRVEESLPWDYTEERKVVKAEAKLLADLVDSAAGEVYISSKLILFRRESWITAVAVAVEG